MGSRLAPGPAPARKTSYLRADPQTDRGRPDTDWRCIIAPSAKGEGSGAPSEVLGVRWTDVDRAQSRFRVRSPKTVFNALRASRATELMNQYPAAYCTDWCGTLRRSPRRITTYCVMRMTPARHRPRSDRSARPGVSQNVAHLYLRMRLSMKRQRAATMHAMMRQWKRDRRLCRSLPSVAVPCRMNQWAYVDLNHGHRHFQCRALPTELYARRHARLRRLCGAGRCDPEGKNTPQVGRVNPVLGSNWAIRVRGWAHGAVCNG